LPVNVVGLDHNIVALAAGYDSYYALTNSGGVKWWGGSDISTDVYNVPVDMVGLTSGVTAIAAGGDHACALTTTGAVKCWGWNAYGQLGDGTTTNRNTPVGVVGLVGGVRAITAGGGHTCAILNTGQVKCWGANFRGQLGDGTTTQRSTPVTVNGLVGDVAAITARGHAESGHTCVLSTAGKIMCWGDNAYGELGIGSFSSSSVPAAVTGLFQRAAQVSAGSYNTCAVSADSGIWCWGTNEAGVLGNGRPGAQIDPTQVVGLNEAVAAITAGAMHTCALTVGGQVKCWGNNNYGEVGDGASGHRHTPVNTVGLNNIQAIEAGYAHSCALTVLGNVKCWGSNFNGQLGNGQQGGYATIPVNVVGLSTGVAAFAVKAGGGHSCALLADGGIRCWGLNRYGQLGDGTLVYVRLTPVAVVNLSGPATSITAGGVHSCALLVNGSVQCWGDNTYGQLGNGSAVLSSTVPVTVSGMISGVIAITSGDFHSCALLAGGEACCWGSNEQGQLGEPAIEISSTVPVGVLGLNSGVTAILAGGDGTCAQVGNAMKCWGRVTHTSNGYFDNVPEPMDVLGLPVPSLVAKMAVGGLHRCALMTSGMVWCWGSNFYGQLGNGTFPFSTIPASVVGFEVVPAGVVYLPIILK
jgi:alpha-tubulin suppressor-like RCC1 family protein